MKKQSIWVFQWRKSVHYWWSYILFSPECKELTSMLDPLLYRWGVPPVVIRCVHWTMQMWVLQTWIKALGLYIVMIYIFWFRIQMPMRNRNKKYITRYNIIIFQGVEIYCFIVWIVLITAISHHHVWPFYQNIYESCIEMEVVSMISVSGWLSARISNWVTTVLR